jgi:RNA polymerase sigma factor (sigma-70 family)
MLFKNPLYTKQNDSELVLASIGGDKNAFCEIVTRYQNLLCSLAYSSVGDVKHSEDLAQEVFIDAWRTLDNLRDPQKLKSWLCGMVRFKISHHHRSQSHQATHKASDIEDLTTSNIDQATMTTSELEDVAITKQHESLMWSTLEQMDASYREPLILFYRDQQSVERVAQELDLTIDTTKQRLSRGRKLLQNAVLDIVEQNLVRSKPGAVFTAAVLSAISTISPPATAAAIAGGSLKAGSFLKVTSVMAFVASFSGLVSSFFGLQAALAQSRTEKERLNAIKTVIWFIDIIVIFTASMFGLKYLSYADQVRHGYYSVAAHTSVFILIGVYISLTVTMLSKMKQIRAQERIFNPEAFNRQSDDPQAEQREYISKFKLFGVPFMHFQFAMPEKHDKPAYAWIAGGSYAYGLLFAWGGIAVAPISVGIISIGFISIGAIGFAVFCAGAVAIGYIGFGASSIAIKAYGSLSAMGWESAYSAGFAYAKNAAYGAIAFGEEVNNEAAAQAVKLPALSDNLVWILGAISVFVILPAIFHARAVKKRMSL